MLGLVVLTLLCSNWNYKIFVALDWDGVLSRAATTDGDRYVGQGAQREGQRVEQYAPVSPAATSWMESRPRGAVVTER